MNKNEEKQLYRDLMEQAIQEARITFLLQCLRADDNLFAARGAIPEDPDCHAITWDLEDSKGIDTAVSQLAMCLSAAKLDTKKLELGTYELPNGKVVNALVAWGE